MRQTYLVVFFTGLMLACVKTYAGDRASEDPAYSDASPESVAPNWMLTNSDGEQVILYDDTDANKYAVMLFWASWCKQCEQQLDGLQSVADKHADKTAFYILNVWEDKDPSSLLKVRGIELPLLLKADAVADRYGVKGTPGLVVVSPERKIILHYAANAPLAELEQFLDELQPEG